MSVGSPLYTLLKSNFRTWVSAKGFWLVAAAALLPLVLTGAWVLAHQDDVAVTELRLEGGPFSEGDEARLSATVTNTGKTHLGAFNVTLAVGQVEGGRLFPDATQQLPVESLEPGASREVTLTWNATPGVRWALAVADQEDVIGERDEFNNQKVEPIAVSRKAPTTPPSAPVGLAGDANATTDINLVVESISREPANIAPGDNATFLVSVRNDGAAVEDAPVTVRVARTIGGRSVSVQEQKENVSFAAGETKTVEVVWTAQEGAFWHEGWVTPPAGSKDVAAEDNYLTEGFAVSAVVTADMRPPEPDERQTIKDFYFNVLGLLHFRLLIPLVALFYAAGVLADEKERGSLAYILTRPIPRWLIPITKFAASFLVASVATVVGLAITYAFLFGTTVEGGDIGFLTTPILAALLTLFVYGALFILLGTLVDRPYLVGILIVLGWENAANILVPWVRNLTLTHHIGNALAGWPFAEGVKFAPEGEGAIRAVLILLGAGVAFLVAASIQMKRREFQVG